MKRALVALMAATALVASGCGSKSSSSSSLGTALGYVPKDASLVIAIDTNPDGGQWQQVNHLLGRFPFGGQVKQQVKSAFNARAHVDYDKDIKPLLGNDLVVAITGPSQPGTQTPYVVAWKLNDESAARRLLQATSVKSAPIGGADVFGGTPSGFEALKDGTFVFAKTRPALQAALERPAGQHMSESDFDNSLGGLNRDSLVRVVGDFPRCSRPSSRWPVRRSSG